MTTYQFRCVIPLALYFLVGAAAYWRSGLM